ncbi:hypothetical protein [Pseudonocardia abyssalis]|uniref:TetR family transcriptional regulator n=1 Tax=Pseudonocardia abyssalis TaxID=2792008 RepID=A0ABS6UMX4_9PSEU|nr:hypothetical protein [Pseudonocardia abyssalis]MBW0117836.1 hypothetical protein [Pseudonocardia abyssalis]MBW0133597.1 hypothetical protein [Pseudonocardia abyssalis]
MTDERGAREIAQAAEAIGDLLYRAVEATLEDPAPEPARQAAAQLYDVDSRTVPESDSGPAQLMGTLTLIRLLGLVRESTADRPERVDEVLGWITESMGKRYAARAKYVTGVLRSETDTADVPGMRQVLMTEFVPSLVWLLAGSVAVFGEGDLDWLRGLEAGTPTTASFLTGS